MLKELGFDGIDFLHNLTERCVQLLDVDAAGILLVDQRGTLNLVAASTDQAARLSVGAARKLHPLPGNTHDT